MFERIVLAIDASEHSRRATQVTAELAAKLGAEVSVVHVFEVAPVPLAPGVRPMDVMPEARASAEKLVADAVAELERAGAKVTGQVSDTARSTAAQIIDVAQATNASLIVMGSRGLSDLHGLMVGSNTHKVIHLAHCPVLVVR